MHGTGHLSAPRGKRVLIHFRSGEKRIATFRKREDEWVYFEECDRVRAKTIRTLSFPVRPR